MRKRPYRIMIDAGHGGRKPGAVNKKYGIKEKDITANVALYMRKIVMDGDYLFTPYMTRVDDSHISLSERCNLAILYGVNAFVSIHCNARHKKGVYGVEIEIYHYRNSRKGREFANIVLGLLLSEISKTQKVISRGIKVREWWNNEKKVTYYVLQHTPMPAILVELGFLSDNEEALFLNKEENQKMMAGAIAEATELFLEG